MSGWEQIYNDNSNLFNDCNKVSFGFILKTKTGDSISIKLVKDNKRFFAFSSHYPKAPDSGDEYKPGINFSSTADEAFENLLKAWRLYCISDDPTKIKWIENNSF